MMDFSAYDNTALGPIQQDEAVFLYGLALVIVPRCVLEFGVLNGLSTRVWLEAGANVIGVDCTITEKAQRLGEDFPGRLTLIKMDMQEIKPEHVTDDIDLVFWDAGHILWQNVAAFKGIQHLDCLHVVHDTGIWERKHAPENALSWFDAAAQSLVHRQEEIAFCDYLQRNGFQRIDFNTRRKFRHGLTVLKKQI